MLSWGARRIGTPLDVLSLHEVPLPEPTGKQLRIRVLAAVAGLPDRLMLEGRYPFTNGPAHSLGQEVVGLVDRAGPNAAFSEGTRVMAVTDFATGWGGLAEYCLSSGEGVLVAGPELSDIQAAGFLGSYHVAYVGLVNRARLQKGETVLVLGGAGRTGSAAIQLATALGANVIATARSEANAQFCRALGAEAVLDPTRTDLTEAVREANGGRPCNIVFDTVGGATYDAAAGCVAVGGTIVLVGFASGTWGIPDPMHVVAGGYSVTGALHTVRTAQQQAEAAITLRQLLIDGVIAPPVEQVFAFDEVPRAIALYAEGRARGQIVVRVAER